MSSHHSHIPDRLSHTHEETSPEENARQRKLLIEIILSENEAGMNEYLSGEHLTVERIVAANRVSASYFASYQHRHL